MKREDAISALNEAIEAWSLAKEISSVAPVKTVFGTVRIILIIIRVSFPLVFC